jgi:hypothetical protein
MTLSSSLFSKRVLNHFHLTQNLHFPTFEFNRYFEINFNISISFSREKGSVGHLENLVGPNRRPKVDELDKHRIRGRSRRKRRIRHFCRNQSNNRRLCSTAKTLLRKKNSAGKPRITLWKRS